MRRLLCSLLFAALLAQSCARRPIVLTLPAVPPSPLRVLCSLDQSGVDPLPIEGTDAAFVDVRTTLEGFAGSALANWAQASHRKNGWELRLEIFKDTAKLSGDRTTVELATRATLTSGNGEVYATQTRDHCKEEATDPTAAMAACMAHLTHDLERWIEGVPP